MQIRNLLKTGLLSFSAFVASGAGCANASGNPDIVGVLATITEPGNAAELGLTQDQLDRLEALIKQHEGQALTFASEIRRLPSAERRAKETENIRLIERQGLALLSEAQQSKAEMWRLKKLGAVALSEPEVAKLMGVSEEQVAKIKNVLEGRSILFREMGRDKATAEINTRIVAVLDDSQKKMWQTLVGKTETAEATENVAVQNPASPSLPPLDVVAKPQPKMIGPEDGLTIVFNATPWKEVLQWLASQAELSLQVDAYPTGTFTYRDPYRRYTVAETMDVMNGVLLGKGFTLVKKQRVLMSVDLGSGESAEITRALIRELAELVTTEDLSKRGDYEIVKCVFALERSTVDEIEKEVKLLIGPQGSVVPLPTAGQVLVCETGGKLRIVRDLIERSEKPDGARSAKIVTLPLKHVSADEVLAIARPLVGLKDGINTSEDLSLSTDTFGNTIYATGSADKLQKLRDITTQVDVKPSGESTTMIAADPPYFKSHRLLGSDPTTTMDVLQSTFAGQTNMKLSMDPKTNNIIADAIKSDHDKIDRIIAELAGQNSDYVSIPLIKIDTQTAMLILEKFFGKQAKDATTVKGPIFYPDTASKSILVKGTEQEVEQVRKLLTTAEASSPAAESMIEGLLMVPLKGRAADRILEQIEMLMEAKKSKSRFRIVLPPNEPKNKNNLQSKDARSTSNNRANPFAKFVLALAEDSPNQVPPNQVQKASPQGSASPFPSSAFNEIVIRRGPNGLIVTSDNPEALKEFNQYLQLVQEQMKNAPTDPTIRVLKHIRAAAAVELIKSIIAGEAATGGSGGGGGLLGDVASSVLGGGGFLGGMFGGGNSGGGSSSASAGVTGAAATGTVVMTADPRLNAIWIQANGSDMQMVEELIELIDIPDSGVDNLTRGVPRTIFINNVAVADVEALVKQVFADRIAPAPGAGGQAQPSPQEFLALIGGGGGRRGGGGGGGGGAAKSELKELTMTVSSDKKNNALIVVASPMLFKDVESFVKEMDKSSEDEQSNFIVVPIPAEVNANTMQNALKSAFGANVKTSTTSNTNPAQGAAAGGAGNPANILQQFQNRGGGAGGFPGGFGQGAGGFGGGQGGGGNRGGGGGNRGGGGQGGGGNRGGGGARGGN